MHRNAVAERDMLVEENKGLREALQTVEDWWVGDGIHRDNGAPACIFKVCSVRLDKPRLRTTKKVTQ